jgi:geranylgeranyl transferase type-2 subunit beta
MQEDQPQPAPVPYLAQLAEQLMLGIDALPAEVRNRHAGYLAGVQNPDGGFSGRQGGSDLYYTGFALRGLALLDALTPEICTSASGFLRASLNQRTSVVDFFSFLYAAMLAELGGGPAVFADSPPGWDARVAEMLETFRTPDGGYAKVAGNATGSTYHTFLVSLCYQLLSWPVPKPAEMVRFILSRRRDDGGFVEIGPMKRSGTNPTAAAVGVLQIVEAESQPGTFFTADVREGVVEFLAAMPSEEDGFRANARAPLADLLSTFTGLWTLRQLGALDRVDAGEACEYAQQLELPTGGFHGGIWDDQTDVEYTFYGLGCLAMMNRPTSS